MFLTAKISKLPTLTLLTAVKLAHNEASPPPDPPPRTVLIMVPPSFTLRSTIVVASTAGSRTGVGVTAAGQVIVRPPVPSCLISISHSICVTAAGIFEKVIVIFPVSVIVVECAVVNDRSIFWVVLTFPLTSTGGVIGNVIPVPPPPTFPATLHFVRISS